MSYEGQRGMGSTRRKAMHADEGKKIRGLLHIQAEKHVYRH